MIATLAAWALALTMAAGIGTGIACHPVSAPASPSGLTPQQAAMRETLSDPIGWDCERTSSRGMTVEVCRALYE